ncbi:hypothetical protein V4B17_04665 [Bartonella sp. B23]
MAKFFPYFSNSALVRWFDKSLPLSRFFYNAFAVFPVLRNLNYFYIFDGILTAMLLSQLLAGIVLALYYMCQMFIYLLKLVSDLGVRDSLIGFFAHGFV